MAEIQKNAFLEDSAEVSEADSGGTAVISAARMGHKNDIADAETERLIRILRTHVTEDSEDYNIPDYDENTDDIVARQIREAAMSEKDPELRKKLWTEYEKYKESL